MKFKKIVGFILGIQKKAGYEGIKQDEKVVNIVSIFVDPAYRRKGIATLLLNHIEDYFNDVEKIGVSYFSAPQLFVSIITPISSSPYSPQPHSLFVLHFIFPFLFSNSQIQP